MLQWKTNGDIDVLQLGSLGLAKFYTGESVFYWYPFLHGVLTGLFSSVYEGPRPPFLLPFMYSAPILLTLSPLPVSIS